MRFALPITNCQSAAVLLSLNNSGGFASSIHDSDTKTGIETREQAIKTRRKRTIRSAKSKAEKAGLEKQRVRTRVLMYSVLAWSIFITVVLGCAFGILILGVKLDLEDKKGGISGSVKSFFTFFWTHMCFWDLLLAL